MFTPCVVVVGGGGGGGTHGISHSTHCVCTVEIALPLGYSTPYCHCYNSVNFFVWGKLNNYQKLQFWPRYVPFPLTRLLSSLTRKTACCAPPPPIAASKICQKSEICMEKKNPRKWTTSLSSTVQLQVALLDQNVSLVMLKQNPFKPSLSYCSFSNPSLLYPSQFAYNCANQ
jgi:hypothetical protein